MAKKTPKNVPETTADSILFSDRPAMTAQERQALAREQKQAKKEEKRAKNRELLAGMWEQIAPSAESRKATMILISLILAVIVIAVVLLALQMAPAGQEIKPGSNYYVNTGDLPEMTEDSYASINEIYYTQNGGVQVYLTLGNPHLTAQHPVRIQVKIMNGEDKVIAAASHDSIPENFFIVEQGYEAYQLYIPKKFVQIADDPLTSIKYNVIVDYVEYVKK